MMRALVAVSIVLTAAVIFGLGGVAAAPPAQLLGMVGEGQPLRLVRIDPQTLRPLPGKGIEVGSGGCASREGGEACWTVPPWSFSPDGTLLAVARNGGSELRSLRLVDVDRLRVTADVRLGGGPIGALAWLTAGRVLALEEVCCSERQRLLAIDVATGRVATRRPLSGSVLRVDRTPEQLIMLIAPAGSIGPARLAVADQLGRVRFVGLEQILAGVHLESVSPHQVERQVPGLGVDADGGRAFVVDRGLVAEVDLASLAVSYHQLARSAWMRLAPATESKTSRGYSRWARWLGDGLLAVSGANEEQAGLRPAGLALVDTRAWSVRTVDSGATGFVVAGDALLATGWSSDSNGSETAIGLAAYGFDGGSRFRLFDGELAWVAQIYGDLAYVGISRRDGKAEPLRIVDLGAGRVVGERRAPLPWLVQRVADSWWGS